MSRTAELLRRAAPAITAIFLLFLSMPAHAQLDESVRRQLENKLDEYISIISMEPVEVKCEEADFLIGSCTDSLTRQFTALKAYSSYINSRIMGDEAVAVHICDKWFSTGKVKMKSEIDLMTARIFAEFNRNSLIGMKAPALTMKDTSGVIHDIMGKEWFSDRLSILYFYDSNCAKCKVESVFLKNLLEQDQYSTRLYCIYTQPERESWTRYIRERLDIRSSTTETIHLWDPEVESDFQMKYGILQTPGIFLIGKDGTILGRRLDVDALDKLLGIYSSKESAEYGSEESSEFYDRVFSAAGGCRDCDEIIRTADFIEKQTLEAGDTSLFKQMTGDLLYYLGNQRGEGAKCGLEQIIRRKVLSRDEIWKTGDDTLKIVSYSEILEDLFSRSPLGSRLPGITIKGTYCRKGKKTGKTVRMDKLRGTAVCFITESCPVCRREAGIADSLSVSDRKARFFLINLDEMLAYEPETAQKLLESFDLSVLPYITLTDRKGLVVRRYMTLEDWGSTSSLKSAK